jgi:hypothetical protein
MVGALREVNVDLAPSQRNACMSQHTSASHTYSSEQHRKRQE